jgi:hypothetical protein
MNDNATFPFSLDFGGSHYSGTITPSGDTDKYGTPVYFRVMIKDVFFAYLCCGDIGWTRKEGGETGDEGLIGAIGEYIREHYQNAV